MDTISRENNTSYLPIAGLILAVIALLIAVAALFKVSSVGKTLAGDSEQIAKIDNIENTANSAAADAQTAKSNIAKLQSDIQGSFDQIGNKFGTIDPTIAKLVEAAKAPPKPVKAAKAAGAAAEGGAAPGTVSADGTYTIKSGDILAKIARANGISIADLEAANPGIDPKHLKVGQKINLPAKQ
jgi:LysM repeat protein